MSTPSRTERRDVDGPADIAVEIGTGRVEVRLVEIERAGSTEPGASPAEPPAPHGELRVEVTAQPDGAPGWVQGLAGLVDVLGGLERRLGLDLAAVTGPGAHLGENAEERARRAVQAVEIELTDGRLAVRGPRETVLRAVPLAVTVHAPSGSRMSVQAGAAPVEVTGRAGEAEITTTGGVTVAELSARSAIRSGAGDVAVGRVAGVLRVRGGAGEVTLGEVSAATEVRTGIGSVTITRLAADLAVRAGSGDICVRDASSGDLDLSTGAGSVRVGVHSGVDASVDLRSATGSASSDLPVSGTRPEPEGHSVVPLRIRGRSAAGSTRVQSAAPA